VPVFQHGTNRLDIAKLLVSAEKLLVRNPGHAMPASCSLENQAVNRLVARLTARAANVLILAVGAQLARTPVTILAHSQEVARCICGKGVW
jgi:hypothetical protein